MIRKDDELIIDPKNNDLISKTSSSHFEKTTSRASNIFPFILGFNLRHPPKRPRANQESYNPTPESLSHKRRKFP